MQWQPILSWPDTKFWRGTVFRLGVSQWPHETPVDLMLIEASSSESGFALIVCSGYKAGLTLLNLPMSARSRGKVSAVSRRWLISHWSKDIYPGCPVEQVLAISNYPSGV